MSNKNNQSKFKIAVKSIHQIFGEDRFVFLSFLSSASFEELKLFLRKMGQYQKLARA